MRAHHGGSLAADFLVFLGKDKPELAWPYLPELVAQIQKRGTTISVI